MTRLAAFALAFSLAATAAYAHIVVAPGHSEIGATQEYELHVHNQGDIVTTSLDLEIPDAVTVLDVPAPAGGTVDTVKAGDRITHIIWKVSIPGEKYVEFKFSARNPAAEQEIHWSVAQHYINGGVTMWSDKPGSEEKGSVTRVTKPTP